jgi:hypothetical protein
LEPESIVAWRRWINELEHHPLDPFEYEAMLVARDDVATDLETFGDRHLFDLVDELDHRFDAITAEDAAEVPWSRGDGRWWARLPLDTEARAYLLRP